MNRLFIKNALLVLVFLFAALGLSARHPITYFLPDIEYDPDIPTPEAFLGHQVGDWHISHALLVQYVELIAAKSGRAIVYEYARSHEHRPLVHLVITSEENQQKLETIRLNHLALTDPAGSRNLDVSDMPVVVRLGYGVHGNESSAHNAAPLVAYYLAAGRGAEVDEILKNTVVIIDPSLNPDGQDRFASWVNRHKGMAPNPNPNNLEFNDVWPGSRTNHYWFDLNRDWLPVQHPESYGRVREFHRWKPNVNTDHHEFGANSSFYFQPGTPGRTNHLTPPETDDLTLEIARYHAKAFDSVGQLYYTESDFDDFYYGKGSSYPDVNGSIGILFEQAGLKGHSRETDFGVLDFAYTIKNQVMVSLSSMEAALEMREKLLEHLRWFYASGLEEAATHTIQAYVFGDPYDASKNRHFLDILNTHQVEVYELAREFQQGTESFLPGKAWVVPVQQPQYRLVRSLFENVLEFEDSLFYDVSTWTKTHAFNLPQAGIAQARQLTSLLGERAGEIVFPVGQVIGGQSAYAYVFSWEDYYAPKALFYLQRHGIRTRVATSPLTIHAGGQELAFGYGSILVPVRNQDMDPEEVFRLMEEAAAFAGFDMYAMDSGWVQDGAFPGSGSFVRLDKPEVLMLVGQGVNSREAGEAWHLLDFRFRMPVTMVEPGRIGSMDLSRYTTLVMVSGNYNGITDAGKQKLGDWVRAGGTVIAIGSANNWLAENGLAGIEFISMPELEEPESLPYNTRDPYFGSRRIPGSIFEARIDTTHPLGYGYKRSFLPVYVSGNTAAKPDKSPFNNPLMFSSDALISGYIYKPYLEVVNNSAGIIVGSRGRGNVISIMDNPNFRGFWFGTNRLFLNAVFFGPVIRS
ncbi:MAG: M14 family zinc carboxypeptidase [Bacteroidales bacterium]